MPLQKFNINMIFLFEIKYDHMTLPSSIRLLYVHSLSFSFIIT